MSTEVSVTGAEPGSEHDSCWKQPLSPRCCNGNGSRINAQSSYSCVHAIFYTAFINS